MQICRQSVCRGSSRRFLVLSIRRSLLSLDEPFRLVVPFWPFLCALQNGKSHCLFRVSLVRSFKTLCPSISSSSVYKFFSIQSLHFLFSFIFGPSRCWQLNACHTLVLTFRYFRLIQIRWAPICFLISSQFSYHDYC